MFREVSGNIFDSEMHTIVNTVNCVGVMGAGIALEFRFRYPDMYRKYQAFCEAKQIDVGSLWIYKPLQKQWILNFPTKKHWKYPTKEEYLHLGLQKFCASYKDKGIESIAFPVLGAGKGGVEKEVSLKIMKQYLSNLSIDVDVYTYNPDAKDSLCEHIKKVLKSQDVNKITRVANLRVNELDKVNEVIKSQQINQISQLLNCKGIGQKTVEKLYTLSDIDIIETQKHLF